MADPSGGAPGACPPWTKIFLILCSFWENPANLYVGATPEGLAPPPTENPVSAPESECLSRAYILTIQYRVVAAYNLAKLSEKLHEIKNLHCRDTPLNTYWVLFSLKSLLKKQVAAHHSRPIIAIISKV